jgi:hypothetical protein
MEVILSAGTEIIGKDGRRRRARCSTSYRRPEPPLID